MQYRIGRELGAGALGRVVELTDDGGTVWAGKILHASQEADDRALRRFELEAKLLAGIHHPNLIAVEGLVDVGGRSALLMELVPGSDLAHLIAVEAPLPPDRVIALGVGIAAGLSEAHRAGLVHRDLKPANILLAADGTPKVGDFGLARATSFAASDPDAVAVAGTPDYMAPESVDPLAIDGRSDLYALGCILCELATGEPPYHGATAFAVLQAHRTEPIPVLEAVPAGLRRVIRWLLAKSPADRPQSAGEAQSALAGLADTAGKTALATLGDVRVADGRRCASCGAIGPSLVHVCFACGHAQLEISDGPTTVFITGPGEQAAKLDAALRLKLLAWLAANPALGLRSKTLQKEVPRLPFTLMSGIDDVSAIALVAALRGLGLEAEWMIGGRFALPAIRGKGWTLAKRVAVIGVSGVFFTMRGSLVGMVFGAIGIGVASLWHGFGAGARPIAKLESGQARVALSSALDAALARVAAVVPAMAAARHRDTLRGVVERALALREAVGSIQRAAMESELAELIDHAAIAASRLDQLEAQLSPDDLRSDDAAKRESWHVRDRWAGRLLQVTAFLDAMRARAVMAKARDAAQGDLDELRLHIAALEEVTA